MAGQVDSFNARGCVAGVLSGWTSIAFASNRSGGFEIYVCGGDGSNPVQLTSMKAPDTGTPAWSPDGKQIVFDSRLEGHSDIFVINAVINAEGGSPHRLTTEPYDNELPNWSRDGHWIYFTSERSGGNQILKVQAEGGRAAVEYSLTQPGKTIIAPLRGMCRGAGRFRVKVSAGVHLQQI